MVRIGGGYETLQDYLKNPKHHSTDAGVRWAEEQRDKARK